MSRIEPIEEETWRQVAAVMNGKDIAVGRAILLTAAGDAFTLTVSGRAYMRGSTRVVSAGTPRQSDVFVERGPNAGKTLRQISTVEGDVLVACTGPPDGERPTEFTSEPGSGRTLSVWLRVRRADRLRHQLAAANWQFLLYPLLHREHRRRHGRHEEGVGGESRILGRPGDGRPGRRGRPHGGVDAVTVGLAGRTGPRPLGFAGLEYIRRSEDGRHAGARRRGASRSAARPRWSSRGSPGPCWHAC